LLVTTSYLPVLSEPFGLMTSILEAKDDIQIEDRRGGQPLEDLAVAGNMEGLATALFFFFFFFFFFFCSVIPFLSLLLSTIAEYLMRHVHLGLRWKLQPVFVERPEPGLHEGLQWLGQAWQEARALPP
jgi:hypothetical protein